MEEIKRYKTSDLVLKVDKNFDPTKLPLQDVSIPFWSD